MADVLATFAVNEILSKVISLATGEISRAWNFNEDLKKLRVSMVFIQALLQDAGEKQIDNMAVRIWLQRLQDLAYDAEDVLDEYGYELLRRNIEIQSHLRRKIRNFVSSSNPVLFRRIIANKIRNINESLERLRMESNGLGLIPIIHSESNIEETDSFLDTSEIVGRVDEVSSILNIIVQNLSNILVLPIVGMAGLGKTTLAKMLSKKVAENNLFDEIFWVCVSNTFDERVILGGMLESLDKNAGGINNMDALLKHLHENLKEKSFFLVLDDVWNEEQHKWDSLMCRLQKINENKRNCIVVTTRSEEVASLTETLPMTRHKPTNLSADECWSIIREKVFGKSFEEIPQDLERIGRDIGKKCDGLPLLAKVLGGTMRIKKTNDNWSSVRDNPVWSTFTRNKEILPILQLSFDRLSSSSLKQCFAYCSIFPEDYEFEKDKLIQLWIAEGYVHPNHEKDMTVEDVAEQYFKILLANSLFQDAKKDMFGNIESCKMHDIVHSLAKMVSRSAIWTSNSTSNRDISNIRHVRLNSKVDIFEKSDKAGCEKLRSLFSKVKFLDEASWNFKRIRVLDIHDSNTAELPVLDLKHLRYLDISRTLVSVLPESISKLYNLQTLRLMNCHSLQKPLRGIENLVKLKHIHFNKRDLTPSHVGRLTWLQTLPMFAVGTESGRGIEELGSLKQLSGKLEIWNLEKVKEISNAYEADMKGKVKLQDLSYAWSGSNIQGRKNQEDVLKGLEPHPHLRKLEIKNFGGKQFSSWLSDYQILGCLRRLELYNCPNCTELPTLGEMPRLEYLAMKRISNVKNIGIEFYTREDRAKTGNGEKQVAVLFPSLIELHMEYMSMLEEWVIPTEEETLTTSFPSLQNVIVSQCHKMKTIPVIRSQSLRMLQIENCSKLTSVPVSHLSCLEELKIIYCEDLSDLEGTTDSVVSVSGLSSLVRLSIKNCGICLLPKGLQSSKSLQYFKIEGLPNLKSVPQYLGDLTSLVQFRIFRCEELTNIPTRLQSHESLTKLGIGCCSNLNNVPENLEELSYLDYFSISMCPKVILVPRNFPNCNGRLRSLAIGGFSEELVEFPNIHSMFNSSVKHLSLIGWNRLNSLPDQFPYLTTSLKSLNIHSFGEIEVLPEWLGNLSTLGIMTIYKCKNLRSLPESMTQLTKLSYLLIDGSPLIAAKLWSGDSIESSKIAHIQTIMIDKRRFRYDSITDADGEDRVVTLN